jgi:hypothetical protein
MTDNLQCACDSRKALSTHFRPPGEMFAREIKLVAVQSEKEYYAHLSLGARRSGCPQTACQKNYRVHLANEENGAQKEGCAS